MSPALDLYLAPTGGLAASDLSALADLLDADARLRAARLPDGPVRRDFIAAHALARRVLSRHRPVLPPPAWRFAAGPHGKPVPVGAEGLAFNLSHGAGLVAVAVGEGAQAGMEVGVDVEALAAEVDMERAAPVFCTHEEQVALSVMAPADRRAALLALWTVKESLLKAAGRGFTLSPQAISCAFAPLELVRCPWEQPQPHVFAARLEAEGTQDAFGGGFQVAVAALGATLPVLRVHCVERLGPALALSSIPAVAAAFQKVRVQGR